MNGKTPAEALIITFATTYDAMCAESCAKAEGLPGQLVPTPRALSAGCGLAWQGAQADQERYTSLFGAKDIRWEQMQGLPPS